MIAVIKYNAGNIRSVENALNRIGYECIVTDDHEEIKKADKVILPGVGEASTAMEYLRGKKLDMLLKSLSQPVLGVCLGLQLMCEESEEGRSPGPKGRNTDCIGIFKTKVSLFPAKDIVPQMGWNSLSKMKGDLFKGLSGKDDVYFVHSYYAEYHPEYTIAKTDYILPYSSAIQKDNFYAVQFHAEKSSEVGATILQNFISL